MGYQLFRLSYLRKFDVGPMLAGALAAMAWRRCGTAQRFTGPAGDRPENRESLTALSIARHLLLHFNHLRAALDTGPGRSI
jgi:hypothetical protein